MPGLNPQSIALRLKTKYPKLLTDLKQSTDLTQLALNWRHQARAHQIPHFDDWLIWLLLGGRGSGKTRTGAEWIREQVAVHGKSHIALVAPTINDAREVMLEGESGLLHIGYPSERPTFSSSRRRLDWPNGAVGHVFTAEDPDGLRGPQFDAGWADEFCAWAYPEETLSNLRLALRLGDNPQLVMTTTPRAIPALKTLMQAKGVLISRGRTADNADNLAPTFMAAMEEAYGGTRLGRQELGGEYIEDLDGALWTRAMLEASYTEARPHCDKVILAIDPPVTSGERSDACGLIVAGRTGEGREAKAFILHDGTVQGHSPESWARAAISLAQVWEADYILAETNQGGELVSSVLQAVDSTIPIRRVHASRSKTARAEPVALLYEQGRVSHCGRFTDLEDELAALGTEAMTHTMTHSPDRADALVWAVTELLLRSRAIPRIRHL